MPDAAQSQKPLDLENIPPEALASIDAWYWAFINKLKLQSAEYSLKGHEYQVECLQSTAKVRVVKKAAQMAFTETEIIRTLHGLIFGLYPSGVLYLFPTADDVSEFSKARFTPMIANNPRTIGKYVRDTDSATIKRIGKGMLFLRGARATSKIEGIKEDSSKVLIIFINKV